MVEFSLSKSIRNMRLVPSFVLATAAILAGCAHKPATAPESAANAPKAVDASPDVKPTESYFGRTKSAVATLTPSATSGVTGIVIFSGGSTSVDVHIIASGLQPGSIHAFHVHDKGNCASADFLSAGDHFNPTHKPHGAQDQPHHAGDMPSLLADPGGKIDTSFTLQGVTLGGADGFVGHAVVLHAQPDAYDMQPSGNAGARIACGVIAAQ